MQRFALATLVAGLALLALAGPAAADTRVIHYRQISTVDDQITLIRGSHNACGKYWYVSQEVHWGVITATKAHVKYVKFLYYKPSAGYIMGGRAAAYNAGGYVNDSYADRNKAYTRASPTNSYAGSWTFPVNRTFYGGQTNGRIVVNVDKHTQLGSYVTGDECHGHYTVVYYVP